MRGKNILWLSLVAMLLSVMMVNIGISAPPPAVPEISMSPTGRLPGPGALGHPGDLYPISVNIADVADLWAVQFTIEYVPFVAVLSAQDFTEGSFMDSGSHATVMNVVSDTFQGRVTFIIMRVGPKPRTGASGSGLLATLNMLVVESGKGPIELVDSILLDSNGDPISHTRTGSAFYYGTTGSLIRVSMPDGKRPTVGDTFTISSKVRNDGDMNLTVKVRMAIRRLDDARPIELLAGQTYFGGYLGAPPPLTYLYADGYYASIESGWNNVGSSLVGIPDGNVANSTTASAMTSFYTFENITLPWSGFSVISNVDLEGYTKQTGGTSNDFDPYFWTYNPDGTLHTDWAWADSLGGSAVWAWTGQRYYYGVLDFPEYYGFPRTEWAVNNAEVLMHNYGSSGQLMELDAMRMRIEFATITPVEEPTFLVQPGTELELDSVIWNSAVDHIGTYEVTVTLEYSSEGFHWNSMGSSQKTFTFRIRP